MRISDAIGEIGTRHVYSTPAQARRARPVIAAAHIVVLTLSVLMIVFISYDTFHDIDFMRSRSYMTFQLAVCMVFIADFFLELALAPRGTRSSYLRSRWLYLLISIPWLTIVERLRMQLGPDALYFIRFVPLARGALALVIVLGYIAHNRITGLFVSYVSILLLTTYFAALIFYEREKGVNPYVTDYLQAFVWCALQTTTLGSSVMPLTVAGKVISVILSFMGIVMYPLFTVYLSSLILKRTNVLNLLNISLSKVKNAGSTLQNATSSVADVGDSENNT